MSTRIIYFLPNVSADTSPLPELIHRLTTLYDPSVLPPWSLRQRLFRSTPTSLSSSTANGEQEPSPRFLQIVSLPDHANSSFVAITPLATADTAEGISSDPVASVISIPAGPSTDQFTQLLVSKLGPLWQQRQTLAVVDGFTFVVGELRVRVGELKQGLGGTHLVRGVLAEVAMIGPEHQRPGWQLENETIQTFWRELDMKGAREIIGNRVDEQRDGFEDVRLWCRALILKN
ncbi:MAG: hypothetical protein Q9219_006865 [cf. Caloplaca sp. 3 TL-2023]